MSVHLRQPSLNRAPIFEVRQIVAELAAVRQQWRQAHLRSSEAGGRELPGREAIGQILDALRSALFPMRLGPLDLRLECEDYYVGYTLDTALHALLAQVNLEVRYHARQFDATTKPILDQHAVQVVHDFAHSLPKIRALLDSDVLAAFAGDPAARSVDEVLLCYPGILAMIYHRVAHRLHILGLPLISRVIAELAHAHTGIDIHPGATIDEGFFIDHGTGVVIGETAVIGKRVRIYQAVTLGAKRFPNDENGRLRKGLARHPLVEDDVVIYAGATVLGRVTIGTGAVIGGNVWVTQDVPAGAIITQARASQDNVASHAASVIERS